MNGEKKHELHIHSATQSDPASWVSLQEENLASKKKWIWDNRYENGMDFQPA